MSEEKDIIFGEKCNGCGNPKYDCKCPDKPKDSAEEVFTPETYFEMATANTIEQKPLVESKLCLILMEGFAESYAKQEVKKACRKQREIIADRHFNNYGQVTTRKLRDKIVEFILNAPSPQD